MLNILIAALLTFAPKYLDADQAKLHADAAMAAEQVYDVDAELLFAMAWTESRFDPDALSYRDCSGKECKRKATTWEGSTPPPGAKPSWYCGVLQVGGWVEWEECQLLREDVALNYMTAAEHLTWWSNEPHCRRLKGDARLDCALRGYSGGYPSINAEATEYVTTVRAQLKRFRAAQSVAVSAAPAGTV